MTPRRPPPKLQPTPAPRVDTLNVNARNGRLRIYLGEDKRHEGRPLYEAIVLKARQIQMAGATVLRGTLGYGRSTRMHTTAVMYSEDLAVVVEIVDSEDRIMKFVALLAGFSEIGLVTYDEVRVLLHPPVVASRT
jgi:PII-like signaling protein